MFRRDLVERDGTHSSVTLEQLRCEDIIVVHFNFQHERSELQQDQV